MSPSRKIPPSRRGPIRLPGKHPGGRPPKFAEPRHPITVTLPVRILDALERMDPDRAKAIARVTEAVAGSNPSHFKPLELVEVLPGKAIILMGPCAPLRRVKHLHLVEVSPARYLLTIPSGTPLESLEVALLDLMESPAEMTEPEQTALRDLRILLSSRRRGRQLTKGELLFVNTGRKR